MLKNPKVGFEKSKALWGIGTMSNSASNVAEESASFDGWQCFSCRKDCRVGHALNILCE